MHYVHLRILFFLVRSVVLVTINAASIAAPHKEAHRSQDRHFHRHREASTRSEG